MKQPAVVASVYNNMTRRTTIFAWCLAFVLVGLLGLVLGVLSSRYNSGPDFWCEGESAHRVSSATRPAWLTTRYRLDLKPDELNHMRMVARLIDADTGVSIGTIRRSSAFELKQQGHRLQINVVSAVKGEAESTDPELASTLGLFVFKPGSSLSFWMRSLSETRYLFDDGNDMFILCNKR